MSQPANVDKAFFKPSGLQPFEDSAGGSRASGAAPLANLKACLKADLAQRNLNLGSLAESLGITQQSVSKWIAKNYIPDERIDEVLTVVGRDSRTADFLRRRAERQINGEGDEETAEIAHRRQRPLVRLQDALAMVQAHLAQHSPTRRKLIGTLFHQLSDDPANAEVAAELSDLLEPTRPSPRS